MKIKKILCLLFLAALVVPTVIYPVAKNYIDSSNNENREYASFPELSLANYENISSEFDDYYADRVPFKNQFAKINAELNKNLKLESTWLDYVTNMSVIIGKDDWLFYAATGDDSSILDYMCTNLYTEEELKEIADRYVKLNEQYKAKGIEFVLFIATNKEQVYSEYMPDNIVPKGDVSRTDQLVQYIKENTDVPVIYTKDTMLKYKDDYQLFYKYDTHWNNLGGFIGSQLLTGYLQGEEKTLDEQDVELVDVESPRDLALLYGLDDEYSEKQSYVVADYKTDITVTEQARAEANDGKEESSKKIIATSDAPDERSLVMINDSFIYSMYPYMEQSFANTAFFFSSEEAKDYINENNPDIVVFEIVERCYHRMEQQMQELYD